MLQLKNRITQFELMNIHPDVAQSLQALLQGVRNSSGDVSSLIDEAKIKIIGLNNQEELATILDNLKSAYLKKSPVTQAVSSASSRVQKPLQPLPQSVAPTQKKKQRFNLIALGNDAGLNGDRGDYQIINMLAKTPLSLGPQELIKLKDYLEKNVGNMALNHSLGKLENQLLKLRDADVQLPDNFEQIVDTVHKLRRFTFKSQYSVDKAYVPYNDINNKMPHILNTNGTLNQEVNEENKLTLPETGHLSDAQDVFEIIQPWFCDAQPSQRPDFYSYCENAQKFWAQIDQAQIEQISRKSPNKVLFSFEKAIKQSGDSRLQKLLDKIQLKVSPHAHTAAIQVNDDQMVRRELYTEGVTIGNTQSRDLLYDDLYVFDVSKLVSEENQKKMHDLLGSKWPDELNKMYSKHERAVHDEFRTSKISASRTLRSKLKIAIKSILPETFSHFKLRKWDLASKRKEGFAKPDKENVPRMLCSQYTAYTTMTALERVNEELQVLAQGKNMIIGNIVESPISGHENMKMMHPSRFLEVLLDRKCVEKLKDQPIRKYVHAN